MTRSWEPSESFGAPLTRRKFLGTGAAASAVLGMGGLSALLAACGSTTSNSGATSASSPSSAGAGSAPSGGNLKMGWVLPETGSLAAAYAPLYSGGVIAIQEINAAGGILGQTIVQDKGDDQANPAKEPTIIQKLESDGTKYCCGPIGSSEAIASLAVSTPAKIIQACFADDTVVGDASKYPYSYQLIFTTDQEATLLTEYLIKNLGIKKIGILSENTSYGAAGTKVALATAKKLGVPTPPVQTYPISATSLDTYVAALKADGVQGIVGLIANPTNAIQAFSSMNNRGWYPPVTGHNGLLFGSLVKSIPPKVLSQVYSISYKTLSYSKSTAIGAKQQALAAKVNAYKGTAGFGVLCMSAPFYDFLNILKKTIDAEKTTDVAKIKEALDSTSNYDGILGSISFTSTNHSGIPDNALCMVSVASATNSESNNCFRELAPGQ